MKLLKRLLFFGAHYISSIFLFAFSISIGVFSKKCRALIQIICSYFNLDFLGEVFFSRLLLPKTEADAYAVKETLEVCELERGFANVSLFELLVLSSIVKKYKPKAIFEIGTFDGRTTLNLTLNSPRCAIIYTLDLSKELINKTISETDKTPTNKAQVDSRLVSDPEILWREWLRRVLSSEEQVGSRFISKSETQCPAKNKIKQLLGDSANFDYTPYINSIDMVFIDGAHSYKYVENDTNVALKLLRNGKGIIVWHDYTLYGAVAKFLHKLKAHHPEYKLFHIQGTTLAILYIE